MRDDRRHPLEERGLLLDLSIQQILPPPNPLDHQIVTILWRPTSKTMDQGHMGNTRSHPS